MEKEWLSDYQTELLDNKSMLNVTKLVPNLMDKKKYVVHYKKSPALPFTGDETLENPSCFGVR